MWRIRRFEERVGQLKRADEVHGLIHLSIGQEGVAAGVCRQLRDDDAVYSGHRAHGHAIAHGRAARPRRWPSSWAAPTASAAASAARCTSSTSSTASWARPASSAATSRWRWAARSPRAAAGSDQVAVVFFGDGAVQAGHFNETVNLATLWELPLILVCENNGFAEFTPRSAHTKVERVSDVVAPYGARARDGRRQRRRRGVGRRSAGFLHGGARRAAGRCCSSA